MVMLTFDLVLPIGELTSWDKALNSITEFLKLLR